MSRKQYNYAINRKYIDGSMKKNIYEYFSSINPIIEHGGGIFSSESSSINISNQESNQSAITNTNTSNETTNTNDTDNSMHMESTVNSNTQVDSSQNISNVNTTDNSSIQNINSSTDTYNVDNSQVINETSMNTTSKLIQSCGMTLEQANAAVNIVKDESVNTNIAGGNTFIVTGNNNTITDVRLESEIDFEGGDIDKSCVLDAVNDMQTELDSVNDNSKSMAGGEGGDTSAEAGGNTTSNENKNDKSDQLDASTDAGMDATQAASTTNENKTENKTENKITTDQKSSQSAEQKASASASTGLVSGSGAGLTENIIIVLVAFALYIILNGKNNLDFNFDTFINLLKSNNNIIIGLVILFFIMK